MMWKSENQRCALLLISYSTHEGAIEAKSKVSRQIHASIYKMPSGRDCIFILAINRQLRAIFPYISESHDSIHRSLESYLVTCPHYLHILTAIEYPDLSISQRYYKLV